MRARPRCEEARLPVWASLRCVARCRRFHDGGLPVWAATLAPPGTSPGCSQQALARCLPGAAVDKFLCSCTA